MPRAFSGAAFLILVLLGTSKADSVFVTPIQTSTGVPIKPTDQEQSQWCWAACVEAVLLHDDVKKTQSQIVHECFGDVINHGADHPERLMKSLTGWHDRDDGKTEMANATYYDHHQRPLTSTILVHELSRDHPVLVFINTPKIAHCVVIIAALYDYKTGTGDPVVYKVKYWDPWPGVGVQTINGGQMSSMVTYWFQIRAGVIGPHKSEASIPQTAPATQVH